MAAERISRNTRDQSAGNRPNRFAAMAALRQRDYYYAQDNDDGISYRSDWIDSMCEYLHFRLLMYAKLPACR
jgi:hypothetical protein